MTIPDLPLARHRDGAFLPATASRAALQDRFARLGIVVILRGRHNRLRFLFRAYTRSGNGNLILRTQLCEHTN